MPRLTEEDIAAFVLTAVDQVAEENRHEDTTARAIMRCASWEDAGVLSRDTGFRILLDSGQAFDITITEGRR